MHAVPCKGREGPQNELRSALDIHSTGAEAEMRSEWKLVGGPTTEWRGVNPDGTMILVETANYWLYRKGICYVGPGTNEQLVRGSAARRLLFERQSINVLRNLKRAFKNSQGTDS